MPKTVLIRTFMEHLQPDPEIPGVYFVALGGLDDTTKVTVHDVMPADGGMAVISMVTEVSIPAELPAPTKPKLVVAK